MRSCMHLFHYALPMVSALKGAISGCGSTTAHVYVFVLGSSFHYGEWAVPAYCTGGHSRASGTRPVPLIVIYVIGTNTNCVNTREPGSLLENMSAIDSMRDVLLSRLLRPHSIRTITGYDRNLGLVQNNN